MTLKKELAAFGMKKYKGKISKGKAKKAAGKTKEKTKHSKKKGKGIVVKSKRKHNTILDKGSSDSELDSKPPIEESKIIKAPLKEHATEGSGSDSEPEDVSFQMSKSKALEVVKKINVSVKSQKDLRKRERKQRQDNFIQQKMQKLESLESQRLSEDFLNSLCDDSHKPDMDAEGVGDGVEKRQSPKLAPAAKNKRKSFVEEDIQSTEDKETSLLPDFIPITEDGTERVAVASQESEFFSLPEKAADFKKELLFGKNIRRQSAHAQQRAVRIKRMSRFR